MAEHDQKIREPNATQEAAAAVLETLNQHGLPPMEAYCALLQAAVDYRGALVLAAGAGDLLRIIRTGEL